MDDWDADDFEVPALPSSNVEVKPLAAINKDDEEEDLALKEPEPVKVQTSASVLAAQERKAKEQEKIFAAKASFADQENETAEERRLREKKQIEDSETALANELLGGSGGKSNNSGDIDSLTKGLGSLALKTKDDHLKYAKITRSKLEQSSAFNLTAFFKSLTKVLDNERVSAESLTEIIDELTVIRDAKAKAAAKQTQKKSKKEIEKQRKEHDDRWGGTKLPKEYEVADKYSHLEDDFM
jgi:hypothetical protein|mmetsp:Transcript_14157/g.15344  ORF Transcript_14157/g.15344 Transcript_14157/m.15344 type:complete len:240 (+) Transcript_14157:63-782(+)|eukprot:CAMPEP_0173149754 /NCGR_PEP_ID=MMETSP1105-20130129/10522_1 /TAXON_ID=2985 /ORGANISM="Ochromonas sp., Strain BG-1" /LENGTH=239 /DNA_ID=CAMNT_0014064697 /DNA_START=43 /DNA_END=762 /DNA_ORIENTATION=+